MKLYRNRIINEVARAMTKGEHTNERTVRTYVLTYIPTGQTLYPLHNFVVRGDNKIYSTIKDRETFYGDHKIQALSGLQARYR